MKALLLAGGLGTRLRPLTYTRPKHLLPIANRAHLEHVFDLLQRHRVEDVVLTTSYLADAFEGVVADARMRGLTVSVTHEHQALGTAGAIKNAEDVLGDETFIVVNGDILTTVDLDALVAFHRERDAVATIFLVPVDDPTAYGVVPTDDEGVVSGFIEKPPAEETPTNLINAGIYVMEPSVLNRIPRDEVWSAERRLFPGLVEDGRLYAAALDAYWIDIGTPQKYLQANLDALAGALFAPVAGTTEVGLVAPGARIDASATLSSVCVGAGAEVHAGATVERSVLLPRAVVAEEAVVRDSIIGEGAIIGPGVVLDGGAVGDEGSIGG